MLILKACFKNRHIPTLSWLPKATLNLLISYSEPVFGGQLQYRSFGKLKWKPSALGFGTMRLPTIGNNQANINEPQTIKLIRYAIDHGVNYIDSAYVYHNGNSEAVLGKALKDGYRQKVKIATKLPTFAVKNKQDLDRILTQQLKRLQTDTIDFYLLHALMKSNYPKIHQLDILNWAEHQIAKGKIKHLGFSFHDELPFFKKIIDAYDWTFCQIQYNYLDETYQAGKEGLKYAASKGLAVIVMEPLAGGLLAVNPPTEIQQEWKKATTKRSAADWALQWIWNQPEVALALSGMNSLQQLKENLKSANQSGINTLTKQDVAILTKSKELFLKQGFIGCTKCRYCSKCPQNIDIPATLAFLNQYHAKRREPDAQEKTKQKYTQTVPPKKRASNCLQCGQCETVCPQHLPVRRLLAEAASSLEPTKL
jgi:uncharacterized protein